MALSQNQRISENAYLALDAESTLKHEFVDGFAYTMVGESEIHNDITANLSGILYNTLRGSDCRFHTSDMRVQAQHTRQYFHPDLTVVCGERDFLPDTNIATLTNPTVIIEVLSPSTELYDRVTKFERYQTIDALQDYVLIAQDKPKIECFSRGEAGTWILRQASGLAAEILIPVLGIPLALSTVYEQITFPDNEPDAPKNENTTQSG